MFLKNVHRLVTFCPECDRLGGPVTGCATVPDRCNGEQKGVKVAKSGRKRLNPKVKQA